MAPRRLPRFGVRKKCGHFGFVSDVEFFMYSDLNDKDLRSNKDLRSLILGSAYLRMKISAFEIGLIIS